LPRSAKITQLTVVLVDIAANILLNIAGVKARTERCDICQYTWPPSEIVKRDSEQLCRSCDLDKYQIRDEDIPF